MRRDTQHSLLEQAGRVALVEFILSKRKMALRRTIDDLFSQGCTLKNTPWSCTKEDSIAPGHRFQQHQCPKPWRRDCGENAALPSQQTSEEKEACTPRMSLNHLRLVALFENSNVAPKWH